MRTRLALPILLTSASIMLSGLGLAFSEQVRAQDTPRPPTVTIPRPRVRPPQPPAEGEGTGPAEGTTPPSKITPMRTGLEETEIGPTPPGARVSFNLEDADLPDLVRLIARITGKRFILPSKARSIKATIYSPTDVTAAEAYQAFLTILAMNGMTIAPSGRYLKIIESSETGAIDPAAPGEATPRDDRFVTRMVRVENVSAEDVATLLNNFKTEAGRITTYAPTNTLIITDTGANIQRMLQILAEVDIPRTGEQIWIEPVHFASAEEMAGTLQSIFPTEGGAGAAAGGGGAAAPAGQRRAGKAPITREATEAATAAASVGTRGTGELHVTSIIPDERSNQLILVATERAYLRILEVMRILDQPVDGEGGIHIYRLQYADAENMAETLQSLIEGGGGAAGAGGEAGGATKVAAPRATAAAAAAGAVAGTLQGEIAIQAYTETNSLLITASLQDYASIRRVLDRLDIPPRQVFIEAVVMELSVSRTTKLGLSYHGGIDEPTIEGDPSLSVLGFGAAQSIGFPASAIGGDTLTGLALGVRGPALEVPGIGLSVPSFGVVLSALATAGDVDVLATPHLIAMDNIEAEINVGSNIPLQTSSGSLLGASGGLGALGGLGGLAGGQAGAAGLAGLAGLAGGLGGAGLGGVQRQSVGTIIRVTPHINDAGEIRLEIEEEISEAGEALPGNLGAIPIQQRIAKTQVLVRDQQTVVIGGLMRDRISTTETKIPILGDIPILGALFRQTSSTSQKTNLLLFLTPYVIRTPDDLRSIFERKMRERQEFIDRYFVFGDHDYRPPLDYSRTRGLLGEIFMELDALDEERQLLEELAATPTPEHHPRAPLGEAAFSGGGDVVIGPEGDVAPEAAPVTEGTVGTVEVQPPQQ